jgi:hypothetical protein
VITHRIRYDNSYVRGNLNTSNEFIVPKTYFSFSYNAKPEMNSLYNFWNYLIPSIVAAREPVSEQGGEAFWAYYILRSFFFAQPVTQPGNVLFVP